MQKSDTLFASPLSSVADFRFDETVAEVFPDMIQRSVPGYQSIINTIGELAAAKVQPDTRVYDLGCSLGAASLAVARATQEIPCEVIGIDNSEAMISRCERIIQSFALPTPVSVHCQSAQDTDIDNASMVIMNFTLQFIPPADRKALLSKIFEGLVPGGILVLSEKSAILRFQVTSYLLTCIISSNVKTATVNSKSVKSVLRLKTSCLPTHLPNMKHV